MRKFSFGHEAVLMGILGAAFSLALLLQGCRQKPKPHAVEQPLHENAKAAAERARLQARYLNRGFVRKPGLKTLAVAACESGRPVRSIARALADHLEVENLVLYPAFFKPAFYADGLFAQIFQGSIEPIERLGLTNTLDALLLAQERVRYATNGIGTQNPITARARLDVQFLPFVVMRPEKSWTYTANGSGFSAIQARQQAEQSLLHQIANDTNLVLVPAASDEMDSYP